MSTTETTEDHAKDVAVQEEKNKEEVEAQAPPPAKSPAKEITPKADDDEEKKEEEIEEAEEGEEDEDEDEESSSIIQALLERLGGNLNLQELLKPLPTTQILPSLTLEGVAEAIKAGTCKKVIVMTGAGISVAAGIPDFRTPGTGLYDNLQKYNLPHPTAVFEIDYFKQTPKPFFLLAKELYPGNFDPTAAHYFIRLLQEKGLLLRNWTQNIDTLERVAGVSPDFLVEAHGSFGASHCINCRKEYHSDWVRQRVFADEIAKCESCDSLVKPDIVFFGESLPARFHQLLPNDFASCDLLIVIGTSLQVQPFASLIKRVNPTTPRLLINREVVGTSFFDPNCFQFDNPKNFRDVKWLGDCQEGVLELTRLLGWEKDLHDLINQKNAAL